MLIGIRKAYLPGTFERRRFLTVTEVHSIGLYCTGNGREIKKKVHKFNGDCFLARRLVRTKCRQKRAPTSLKSPSSVVPDYSSQSSNGNVIHKDDVKFPKNFGQNAANFPNSMGPGRIPQKGCESTDR